MFVGHNVAAQAARFNRELQLHLDNVLIEADAGLRRVNPWMYGCLQLLRCGYCYKQFHSLQSMEAHLNTTTQHQVFSCCGDVFETEEALQAHIARNDCDENRRKQERQQQQRARDIDLFEMIDRHTHRRGHVSKWLADALEDLYCPYCRELFDDLNDLEDHLLTTNEHHVFSCCGRVFQTHQGMRAHQQGAACRKYES
ncbi:hypothetical protein THASP1DRAFT_30334 [Thamnocephalis sphaerospora]|uniref:C2H2-type domain-containing protein n=1 Tax=Thamnocephalis sphaerospora TaxID=78915 RepID=A0A4P9XQR8_9FUNG|nr:hypothetical protein THASP1DRAFT_30334 [Thamnocephalis sphaerospora]|eukprot:RKP07851.1 hypothetical protein THASP1DRAFT_30334 [Thamnocephalis sphaerospora]